MNPGDKIAKRFTSHLRASKLFPPGAAVLVAASGGSDSTALVELFARSAPRLGFELAGIAHVHHHLRGDDADEDAAFCGALAERLGLPFIRHDADVASVARARGESIEAAGRFVRYEFFEKLARKERAVVATGHTLDDRLETHLLKLGRGEGGGALAGIRPRHRDFVIRPLLPFRRVELREFLGSIGCRWREDATNAPPSPSLRASVRGEAVPALVSVFGESFPREAASAIDRLLEDAECLDRFAESALERATGPGGILDLALLDVSEPAIARRVLAAFARRGGVEPLPRRTVDRILAAIADRAGNSRRFRAGSDRELVVERGVAHWSAAKKGAESARAFEYSLEGLGVTDVPEAGGRVRTELVRGSRESLTGCSTAGVGSTMWYPLAPDGARPEAIPGLEIVVRSRRAGDRIRPLGAAGRTTLQELFIDRKIPRDERARIPVVTIRKTVMFVPGLAIAEETRLPERETPILQLTWEGDR